MLIFYRYSENSTKLYVDRGICATPFMLETLAASAPFLEALISDSKDPARQYSPNYSYLSHLKLVDDYWHQMKSFIRPALKQLAKDHHALRHIHRQFEGFLFDLQVVQHLAPTELATGRDDLCG
jgi:hypothetical protein